MAEPHRYLGLAELKNEGTAPFFDPWAERTDSAHKPPTWRDLLLKEIDERSDIGKIVAGMENATEDAIREYAEDGRNSWTVWTESRVYFPLIYDGYCSVGSAPRDPTGEKVGPF